MKKFTEQLKNKADDIRLSAQERRDVRDRLVAFMEYHPMPAAEEASSWSTFAHGFKVTRVASLSVITRATGVFAVLFFVVVPALAERALPGEMLYPIKLRFNEELRGALVSSPYQKIEWETERLERRLAEARLLSDAGRLTPEAEADVARAIKSHSDAAKQSIASIRVSDTDEAILAEIALTSALEVQSEMIGRREQASGSVAASALVNAVNEAKSSVAANGSESASYAKLLARVESETTRAYEYLNSLNGLTSAEERGEIERRLTDVRLKIETAATTQQVDEVEASKQLAEALGSTRKIISFMTNLEVRKSVTIQDLVPVVPTIDERRHMLQVNLAEMKQIAEQVTIGSTKLATTSTDYIELKEGLNHYHELHTSASSSLAVDDLVAAEAAVTSALDLAKGMLNALKIIGVDTTATSTSSSR